MASIIEAIVIWPGTGVFVSIIIAATVGSYNNKLLVVKTYGY